MADNQRVVEDIVAASNRKAVPIGAVLAKCKINTQIFQEALAFAEKKGYEIRLHEGMVFSRVAVRAAKRVVLGATKPGRYHVGYWSDTHFGCRHSAEDAMLAHRHRCWDAGAKVMVHTGDLLDGNRQVLLADQNYVGWESQYLRLERTVKKGPPLADVAIDGNHDGYYSAAVGTPSGALVAARLREKGRDWHYAGMCEGRAEIHGADWYLWHPHGGSQSKMGVINVLAQKVAFCDEHIDVLAMGHLHKNVVALADDNVLTITTGTYQRKMSEFANRISQSWDIGGSIVSYELDKKGGVHELACQFYRVAP